MAPQVLALKEILTASRAGVNPASTGSDIVVAIYNVPANSFDQAGRGVVIAAAGGYAANGHTKECKIIIGATAPVVGSAVSGGTTIADTGAVTTSGGGWLLSANVVKYGAAASNTQTGINTSNSGAALSAPAALTLAENAIIPIVVTANATTTATDIALNLLQVKAAD